MTRKIKSKKEQAKVADSLNYVTQSGFKFTQPSMTVPDQSMSMKEILARYATGAPIKGEAREPIYLGEDGEGIDLKKLDLADREEVLNTARAELKGLAEKLTNQDQKTSQIASIEAKAEQNELNETLNENENNPH